MIQLYTDGGYRISKNVGGWAYILKSTSKHRDKPLTFSESGYVVNTTSNRMELQGVIEGLRFLNNLKEMDIYPLKQQLQGKPPQVTIYSDSSYVVNSANLWIKNWIKNDFGGKKNVDLWLDYIELSKNVDISFNWIRGHSGNRYNESCDQAAAEAIDKYLQNNL